MKKSLLYFLFLCCIHVANAQEGTSQLLLEGIHRGEAAPVETLSVQRLQRGPLFVHRPAYDTTPRKVATYYVCPLGVYFLAPDAELNLPGSRCIAPANFELFSIAAAPTKNLAWKFYDNDSISHQVVERTQNEQLVRFTLPSGRYPAPTLIGHAKDNNPVADSTYMLTADSIEYGNGYNSQYYVCNADPLAAAPTIPTELFYVNDATAASHLEEHFEGVISHVKIKSVAELFRGCGKPFYLLGGAAHLFSEKALQAEDLKFTFTKFDAVPDSRGKDSIVTSLLEVTPKITQCNPIGDGGIYYVRFELPSKPLITSRQIEMTISPSNDQVKFIPLIVPQQKFNDFEGGTAAIYMDYEFKGKLSKDHYMYASGIKFGEGMLKSWMMGLFMTYDKNIATGINDITSSVHAGVSGVYTLSGQKINVAPANLESGCYIINGKKVMVK